MSTTQNTTIIRRFFDDMWNANNPDVADALIHPDYVDNQGVQGPASYKQGIAFWHQILTDMQFTVDEIVAEGERKLLYRHPFKQCLLFRVILTPVVLFLFNTEDDRAWLLVPFGAAGVVLGYLLWSRTFDERQPHTSHTFSAYARHI